MREEKILQAHINAGGVGGADGKTPLPQAVVEARPLTAVGLAAFERHGGKFRPNGVAHRLALQLFVMVFGQGFWYVNRRQGKVEMRLLDWRFGQRGGADQ